MNQLAGKIALITGASSGIGEGVAKGFAREGAALILVARRLAELEKLAASLPNAIAIQVDVTQEDQVQKAFAVAMEKFGRLDILVNNAGVFDGGPLHELSLEAWEKVMSVNLRGPFLCTKEAMKIMREQKGGRIINIGSISAQRVRPNSAAYSTSKHGIVGLTQVTALEGREFGISCGCLHPGNVAVERLAGRDEPAMQASELAEAVIAMAALPPHITMLETIVMPMHQAYIGRG
jgi:NAD(P)-dependent dehydrogenase (short-subunit alcohol dehydrogenase family)